MTKALCFAIADLDYLDIIKVGLYTYSLHNSQPIKIFIEDGSAEVFRKEIPLDCVEFINYDLTKTKCYKFYNKHKDLFSTKYYYWSSDHILNMLSANEILDQLIAKYENEYDAIIRLDLDVLFYGNIAETIDKFIESNRVIGSIIECVSTETRIGHLGGDYMNAGSLFFRMRHSDLIHDHTEQTFEYLETENTTLYFPDQDAINLMYFSKKKFRLNDKGWIANIYAVDDIKQLSENTIFVHYAGPGKPFKNTYPGQHPLRATYPVYLEAAKQAHCSERFIKNVENCIDTLGEPDRGLAIITLAFSIFFNKRNKTKCITTPS